MATSEQASEHGGDGTNYEEDVNSGEVSEMNLIGDTQDDLLSSPLPSVGLTPPPLMHWDESLPTRPVSPESDSELEDEWCGISPGLTVQAAMTPPSVPSESLVDSLESTNEKANSAAGGTVISQLSPPIDTLPLPLPPPPIPSVLRTAEIVPTTPVTTHPSISSEQVDAHNLAEEALTKDTAVISQTLGDASTSRIMPASSDWPKHVVDSYRYLTGESGFTKDGDVTTAIWGDEWLACLTLFLEFQEHAGFPELGPSFPASTHIRPFEIAVWMKNGRHAKDIKITDLEIFHHRWWQWWRSLQPESRVGDKDSLTPVSPDMDWSGLQKPGKNGFLLIMVSLMWWGKSSDQDELWRHTVIEVTAVLSCLTCITLPNIDPPNTANAGGSKRGRRGDADKAVVGPKKRKY